MALELLASEQIENIVSEEATIKDAEELYNRFNEFSSLLNEKKGAGLAAPQVGIFKRMFIWRDGEDIKMVFNPKIYKEGNGKIGMIEGCLTFGDKRFGVVRWKDIRVVYQIFDGEKFLKRNRILHRIESAVFQHETDHLNGITIRIRGEEIKDKNISDKVAV